MHEMAFLPQKNQPKKSGVEKEKNVVCAVKPLLRENGRIAWLFQRFCFVSTILRFPPKNLQIFVVSQRALIPLSHSDFMTIKDRILWQALCLVMA